jgi:hypothetical protein
MKVDCHRPFPMQPRSRKGSRTCLLLDQRSHPNAPASLKFFISLSLLHIILREEGMKNASLKKITIKGSFQKISDERVRVFF